MAQLNANIPYTQVFVKNSFLERNKSTEKTEGYIFGVKSQLNRPFMFHVQLRNGAVFWSIPLTAFCWNDSILEDVSLSDLQIWDCQSNDLSVTKFAFLENKQVDIRLATGKWLKGIYLFTIDNYEGDLNYLNLGYSGQPDEKVYHFIQLENGYFGLYPNNHLRWHNKDFIKAYSLTNPPKYKPFQEILSCEQRGITASESEDYFYKYTETK